MMRTQIRWLASEYTGPKKNILDFNSRANTGDVAAGTTAWAALLAYCNTYKVSGYMPAGTYTIGVAPGTTPDPASHNCPEVDYDYIDIEGAGQDLVTIECVPDDTATRPGTVVSRPLLKAVAASAAGSFFRLKGVTLSGGIDTARTLYTGADPDSCSLIEVRGYARVELDVGLTEFAQNFDNTDEDNGNFGRRGPMLIWGNYEVEATFRLFAPTFREGPFFGNNIVSKIRPIYRGPVNDANLDAVSSPFNSFSRSTDPAVGGEYLEIDRPDFTGCWRGSAGNFYIPGDIVFIGGPVLRGSITTTNTTTGNPSTTGDTYNFGKGWDIGGEIGIGPTRSVHIEDGRAEQMLTYSWKFNRQAYGPIGRLTGSASVDNAFVGLDIAYVNHLDFSFKARKVLWYYPDSPSGGGIAVRMLDCDRGFLRVDIDGSETGVYNYPNSTPPSTGDVPRISRLGIIKARSPGVTISGRIKDCAGLHIYEDVDDVSEDGVYPAIWNDLHFYTDVYPTSNSGDHLIRVGTNGSLRAASLAMAGCSFNDMPVISSRQIDVNAANPGEGYDTITIGNPNYPLVDGTRLGSIDFYNGDISSYQEGVRGRIEARAADSIGRGSDIFFMTGIRGDPMEDRLAIKDYGATQFIGLASSPATPTPGDTYYDSTLDLLRVWNGVFWDRVGLNVASSSGAGTKTPTVGVDAYEYTAISGLGVTIAAPTGTPKDFHRLMIRLRDDGTSRPVAWDAIYRASASGPALPSATTLGKTMYLTFVFNATDTKWDLINLTDDF
tara:strand:- start:2714 stop:5038 length:2325 start_codon:yes stop_codon:yes gene_type:complete